MRSAINSELDNYRIAGEINFACCRRASSLIACLIASLSVYHAVILSDMHDSHFPFGGGVSIIVGAMITNHWQRPLIYGF